MGFKSLPKKNAQPLEKEVQRDILDWLEKVGVWAWRSNRGAFGATHNGKRRFVTFGCRGQSDISGVLPGGRALFVEVKRPGGDGPTPDQQWFIDTANRSGGLAFVARSVLDVQRALAAEGYYVRLGTMDPPSYGGEALESVKRAMNKEV
jgi:hypothetical protein